MGTATNPRIRITPRWLKLRDAAAYSAIGEQRLVSLADNGTIKGFKDPDSKRSDWIFDRESIDAYREEQASGSNASKVELRVAEIMASQRKRSRK